METKSNVRIRSEMEEDYEQISRVLESAFGGKSESELVQKLRKTVQFNPKLSLVAEWKNNIIGYILFYPIVISSDQKKKRSLILAPVSVHPDHQNRGVGIKLVKKGLKIAKSLGFESVIVIGHPGYYPRFGFEKARKRGILTSFKVPDDAFLAKELVHDGLKNCEGTIELPKEFEEAL